MPTNHMAIQARCAYGLAVMIVHHHSAARRKNNEGRRGLLDSPQLRFSAPSRLDETG